MSRVNKYRGMHIHVSPKNEHLNGKWVYGYLSDENYINSPELEGEFLVDKETVGQYIGVLDKNENEIYEGDIVKLPAWITKHGDYAVCKLTDLSSDTYPIIGFAFFDLKGNLVDSDEWDEYEVVGNVYENANLLKEAGNE